MTIKQIPKEKKKYLGRWSYVIQRNVFYFDSNETKLTIK